MLRTFLLFYLCQCCAVVFSQKNIIPNSSFETFTDYPTNWYYNGEDFTELVKFWCSPTPASPDAYGPLVPIPDQWIKKGFGQLQPQQGEKMIGLTLYGCDKGKPHCREYVQIRFSEPLVVHQQYQLTLWIAHLDGALYVNNLGFLLSKKEVTHILDRQLEYKPQLSFDDIINPKGVQWIQKKITFKADEDHEFITIGNFYTDKETDYLKTRQTRFQYAYYYLDNLSLVKQEPILPVPERPNSLTDIKLVKGNTINLDNIYFDHDRADFLSRSYGQLDNLVQILERYPLLKIRVQGHTDNRGDFDYNMKLSNERASAVVQYLVQQGISSHRLSYKGFGSQKPLSTNASDEGRKKNRRVEFLIIDK